MCLSVNGGSKKFGRVSIHDGCRLSGVASLTGFRNVTTSRGKCATYFHAITAIFVSETLFRIISKPYTSYTNGFLGTTWKTSIRSSSIPMFNLKHGPYKDLQNSSMSVYLPYTFREKVVLYTVLWRDANSGSFVVNSTNLVTLELPRQARCKRVFRPRCKPRWSWPFVLMALRLQSRLCGSAK